MRKRLICTAIAMASPFAVANHDLPIELVDVVAERQKDQTEIQLFGEAPLTKPIHDAGELLRSVSGMNATRRGGRGFEPIIRGQSQNRINIISNGAYNFGACPGRMDPPSTYVGFDNFDQVTVIKGNRSVVYGAGGSGGTLLFKHQRPELNERGYTGEVRIGHTGNSDLDSSSIDFAAGGERGFVRVFAENKNSENYDDGSGQTVSSAFDSKSYGVIVGADLTSADYLELSFESANEEDIWYAGNGMDAPHADSTTARVEWIHDAPIGAIDRLELNLYRSDVAHLMDNYTLRNRSTSPMGMAAPSSSDTWGGRLMATVEDDRNTWRFGIDHRANDRQAALFMDMGKNGSYEMLTSLMWPDVEQRQTGLFVELDHKMDDHNQLRFGLRYDDFSSEATSSDQPVGMMGMATPDNLYQTYYGADGSEQESRDVGLVLGWDINLSEHTLLSTNLSRSVRTPDASEQFMARKVTTGSWIGNPTLEPEVHQQLDITLITRHQDSQWSATLFWDEVSDYIERYQSGSADLYRNIDATLYGAEFEAGRTLIGNLSGRVGIAYTRGYGEYGDLANISPLEATVHLDYKRERWAVGAEWVLSDRQKHVDEDNEVAEKTPGFGVLNLYGNWQITDGLLLEAGVENVGDKTYAYHVNSAASDPFDPDAVRVNEPGRQYWIKARYSF